MGESTAAVLFTLMLTITHGQLGQFTDGQVITDVEDATTASKAYLVNGKAKSISIPFSMVPESTFNQNILVRPKLLFARTRIHRKDSLGDILGELESSKHEIFAPILEEEGETSTSTSSSSSTSTSSSLLPSSIDDDPFMTKRVDRPNRFRSKRQRFRFTSKSRRRQSQDDEEDEEIAQPTEIDEVDEVKEVRRPIRIRQRNSHHRRQQQHEHKYKSSPRSGHRRGSIRGGHKKVKSSKVDEDDDEWSESPSDPNDSSEEKDDETITTTATATTNPSKSHMDTFSSSSSSSSESAHNLGLIPNLLPKSYETYSPDSSSAISSFVSRLREDIKKGRGNNSNSNSNNNKLKVNQQQSQLPWIPETELSNDDFDDRSISQSLSDEQVRREANVNVERAKSSGGSNNNNNGLNRKSSYRINTRPAFKSHGVSMVTDSPGDDVIGEDGQGKVSQLSSSNNSSVMSSASSFNPIHLRFTDHLPPLMNDKITERLYSRGLLVYLKDFKYGGL